MERSLNALRFPLIALAAVIMAACGKAPEATQSGTPPPPPPPSASPRSSSSR